MRLFSPLLFLSACSDFFAPAVDPLETCAAQITAGSAEESCYVAILESTRRDTDANEAASTAILSLDARRYGLYRKNIEAWFSSSNDFGIEHAVVVAAAKNNDLDLLNKAAATADNQAIRTEAKDYIEDK